MSFSWSIFIDLGIVCSALLLATFLRARVRFFQTFLIPNALTAGFLLLPFYNFLAPLLGMGSEGLGNLVFHLLNLSFAAMSLRGDSVKGSGRRIFSSSITTVSQYTLQAAFGLAMTLVFIRTLYPQLFPTFGFLFPLGFALGPGQAFAIGKGWESLGFEGGGNLGLVFAALGYLWSCFVGIFLINLGRKRGWLSEKLAKGIDRSRIRTGVFGPKEKKPIGSLLTTESEAIDTMSFNLAVVLAVYLLAFLFLKLLSFLLSFAGKAGMQLATNLWGIAFIFCALAALLVRRIMVALKIEHTIDTGSLNRISGVAVDIMVASALGAITIVVLTRFWTPILFISIVGGVLVTLTILWSCSRIFTDHRFEWMIMLYGNMTGTLSTGLALLRVIDPDYETPVATDYMYSTGLTFVIVIPMILMLNLPAYWHTTGEPFYLWITWAILGAYLIFSIVGYSLLAGGRAYKSFFSLWFKG